MKGKASRILVFRAPAPDDELATLASAGLQMTETTNSATALEALQQPDPFDVLVVDPDIADESVTDEVVRTARTRSSQLALAVICSKRSVAERARLRWGADEILAEPLDEKQLVEFVERPRDEQPTDRPERLPRVLVVDDDEIVLLSVADTLEAAGYDVTSTTSPTDALPLVKRLAPDILITDLMMAEMPGIELVRAARTIRPSLVAVVMTGYGSKDNAIAAVREGASDFLDKPLTPDILRLTINRSWRARRTELANEALMGQLREANEALAHQIAERERIETELFQAQKLEAIGQLAAGIAHEINTPMQFISDNVQFLGESFGEVTSFVASCADLKCVGSSATSTGDAASRLFEVLEALDAAYLAEQIPMAIAESKQGLRRLSAIVNAMRNFTHPGGGQRVGIDINGALHDMLTVSRNEWKYVGDVVLDLADDLPLVICFPGEISQALLNIILNAAHAIAERAQGGDEQKGRIAITTQARDGRVLISIEDNGTGIPVSARPRVFEPFFTTKEVGKGTGQGLAIARSIVVKKHGGKIWFTSTVGEGTTFWVELPGIEDE